MASQSFIYAVLPIPVGSADLAFYAKCQNTVSNTSPVSYPSFFTNETICGEGQILMDPKKYTTSTVICATCDPQVQYHSSVECGAAIYSTAGKCPTSTTVYAYMGGDPAIKSTLAPNLQIPAVNGMKPIQLTWTTDVPLGGSYASVTMETAQGAAPIKAGDVPQITNYGMVVAYDLNWFVNWIDLDLFAPFSVSGKSIFLNQASLGNPNSSTPGAIFYIATGNPYDQSIPVPTLEDQWPLLLRQFCGRSTTASAPGQFSPAVNPGWGFSSNILGRRTDGGTNYCANVYQTFQTGVLPYPASPTSSGLNANSQLAISDAISDYCNAFPLAGSYSEAPPECGCIIPTIDPSYVQLQADMLAAGYNVPNQPEPSDPTFGAIGCWWQPCSPGSIQSVLIPPDVQALSGNCHPVCLNFVNIIAGAGGKININDLDLKENLVCCQGGTCTSVVPPTPADCSPACTGTEKCYQGRCIDGPTCGAGLPACPTGQFCIASTSTCAVGCQIDSDCTADQDCVENACVPKAPSFWDKYKIWIIVGGISLFIIIIFLLALIFLF